MPNNNGSFDLLELLRHKEIKRGGAKRNKAKHKAARKSRKRNRR